MDYGTQLLGQYLLTKRGYMNTRDVLANKRFVLLMVSASWCGACTNALPVINNFYNILQQNNYGNYLEIVHISKDNDEQTFNQYCTKFAFSALPYNDRQRVDQILQMYSINTLPTLILLDAQTGRIVDRNALQTISNARNLQDIFNVWK
jgi:nucleoredoxin